MSVVIFATNILYNKNGNNDENKTASEALTPPKHHTTWRRGSHVKNNTARTSVTCGESVVRLASRLPHFQSR
jgi:hypothetical protein